MIPHPPASLDREFDELARIELQIARRADELNREPGSRERRRDCWLEAEREFWRTWFAGVTASAS
jgi:hypothetical protein